MHVLFLGNGFDLYHDLKTSYMDFLKILKNVGEFEDAVSYHLKESSENEVIAPYGRFKDYFEGGETDGNAALKICNLLKENCWAKYYANCNANIKGWIDFENEMVPALDMMRNVFRKNVNILHGVSSVSVVFDVESYNEGALLSLWNDFFERRNESQYIIKFDYFDYTYGILKDKIIQKLEKDLDDFILAFIIYLQQFVESRKIDEYEWIKKLNPDAIISFNYTQTEKRYFQTITDERCSHIHGLTEDGNLVFGTDLVEDNDIDFMHFSKKYQRFTKVGDFSYMDYLNDFSEFASMYDRDDIKASVVSFIGCSLDINDSSIFKEYMKEADNIDVYCYGFDGYKKAVRNLISIFESKTVGEYMHSDDRGIKLKFFDIKDVAVDGEPRLICSKEYYRESLGQI